MVYASGTCNGYLSLETPAVRSNVVLWFMKYATLSLGEQLVPTPMTKNLVSVLRKQDGTTFYVPHGIVGQLISSWRILQMGITEDLQTGLSILSLFRRKREVNKVLQTVNEAIIRLQRLENLQTKLSLAFQEERGVKLNEEETAVVYLSFRTLEDAVKKLL
jgi:hypothetical protein